MEEEKVKEDDIVEIQYEDRFVAFLDILGFKDFVYKNDIKKINHYVSIIKRGINYLQKVYEKEELGIGYIVISDSIIISVQKRNSEDENINVLRHLCIAVGLLQYLLVEECGIWLRGAISTGETYFNHENNQVIGKAYIDAYLLEDKFVSNPQVILDNKIIKDLKFNNSTDLIDAINDKDNGYLKFKNCGKTILYDWKGNNYIEKDFPLFVDYLSIIINTSIETNTHDVPEDIKDYIKNLCVEIEKNIYSDTSLYKKHKWTANYALSLIDKNNNGEFNEFKERLEKL